jgi:chitinase
LNAPLYARANEVGFFGTLNINHSVNYWMSKGLDRSKIIIGLPTYGHSFKLVNPFNTKIGAPAEDYGSVGFVGFVTYSQVCWFQKTNLEVRVEYDTESCSPWLHTGLEWISFDDERSMACKANYAKDNNFGGIMVFSLNTDDFQLTCSDKNQVGAAAVNQAEGNDFPLLRKIHSILFHNSTNGN